MVAVTPNDFKNEAGGKRSRHGAQGVDPVEKREPVAQLSGAIGDGPRKHRKGPAHQRRGDDHRDGSEDDPERGQPKPVGLRDPCERSVGHGVDLEQPKEHERERSDPELEEAVQSQRARRRVDAPAEEQAAQRNPAHEHGQDDRDREVGAAEHDAERADPRDLVDEACRSGDEKEGVEDQGHGRPRILLQPASSLGLEQLRT
jgi:hypothetical protein